MMKATSWQTPYVHIECACNKQWGLEDLYYCYQCSKILCVYCINEEIDSFYCRVCMENMPTTEANAFKNRCSRCFQCPVCFTNVQIQLYSLKSLKYYHFSCNSCYWDSRSFELKGSSLNELLINNKEFCNRDSTANEKFKELQDTYKEAQRFKRKTNFRHQSAKQTWTFDDLEKSKRFKEPIEPIKRAKAQQISLTDLLSENLVYSEITSIQQRLLNISQQPRELGKSLLQPLQLLTKRSKRCKTCKKYVLKPETNPTSTNFFKMENLFVNMFPRILIRKVLSDSVLLVFSNPSQSLGFLRFEGEGVPTEEIFINAYDPVIDLITSDGGPDEYDRDKNMVAIPIARFSETVEFLLNWRFMRGSDTKIIYAKIFIRL